MGHFELDTSGATASTAAGIHSEGSSGLAVQLRDRLLLAVAQALKVLLGDGELKHNIAQALQLLGQAARMHRVKVILDQPGEAGQASFHALTYEWWAPGFVSQTSLGVVSFSNAAIPEYLLPLQSGRSLWQLIDDVPASVRPAFERVGMRSMGVVPIFAKSRYAGLVAFDDCVERRRWTSAEIEALTIAAHAIGAVIERERLEALRLAGERQRALESQALNHLLEGVVAASRALLEAADFQLGLQRWLTFLARAVNADRATYGTLEPMAGPHAVASSTAHWVREGMPPTAGLAVPASADFVAWAARLQDGDTVWAQREDLIDPLAMEFWDKIGCQTKLILPVVVEARSVGFLAFDWVTRQERRPAFTSVLCTAADGLAAAIKRQEALQALLAERERSASVRTAELAQANASMRRTLARLAAAQEVDAFLATALLELHQQAGAASAFLFAPTADGDSRLRLYGSVRNGHFQRQGEPDDPHVFERGFVPSDEAFRQMDQKSSLLWRQVDPARNWMPRDPDVQRWLQQKQLGADASCLLQVGDRSVGLLVLNFTADEPLPPSRSELLVALSQPMALALELGRLGRVAQRAAQDRAVLAERNRMARDVHDTLAQGFGAISMQLQAAARATSEEERARFVARATQEAQANLVESRHTIRMLRGMADHGEARQALIQVIEDALASRLRGSPLSWRVLTLPEGSAEPALDVEARRELERITQEAATNAVKHSRASLFEARLEIRPDGGLALRLMDHGCGFDPQVSRDGFGLTGMRERAERIGATLHVESGPGGPTTVVLLIPPPCMLTVAPRAV